jgi:glycosyltransferase involved in cell wall biosynthesis
MMHSTDQPLVSVCIQTYQHAPYIRECIESALAQQTSFPFEIIIGEDDSTDGTREICREYEDHPQVRLFLRSEKDKIYINSRKTGRFNFIENMKAARGKYIALLDGDDYWTDTSKLQVQADFMEANPDCSISCHKVFRRWEQNELYVNDSRHQPRGDTKLTIDDLLHENIIAAASCMFVRRYSNDLPAWFYELPFIDYALHVHNAQRGKIGFIDRRMAVYRYHRHGMWSSTVAPGNNIRLWQLYTIMARNINGDIGNALQEKRYREGLKLVDFYKTHFWENRKWLSDELAQRNFRHDEELSSRLASPPGLKDYARSSVFYIKRMTRKLLKA